MREIEKEGAKMALEMASKTVENCENMGLES